MFKNKIAIKLTWYFAICLLVFSLIIGSIFVLLFRNHTIRIHRNDLEKRALAISETLSGFERDGDGMHRGNQGGYMMYLRFLDDIAMTDIWIINQDYDLITCGQGHHMGSNLTYKDLPKDADSIINDVFDGKIAFSESFSALLNQPTITVGTPIKNGKNVVGVVLLHSPVEGTNEAIKQGIAMLSISIISALLLAFLLSLWLSKNFTDPIISKEAAEALRLEKLRRDFVANISHELRTPVAVMRGSLEALVDEVVTEPEQVKSYHKEMLSETLYLQRLVGDLLDLSRLQNSDFAMEMQDIILDAVIDDVIRSAAHIGAEKNITINLQKNSTTQTIFGDYGRLRQMFLIVLDNAVKFSPENSDVDIVFDNKLISVNDCGMGIPTEELPYIFDRFYKSRSEENKIGTGLGLAIAKQIAGRHNMILTAENIDSSGARFIFKW